MTKQHAHKFDKRRSLARIYYGPEGHETSMWWTVSVTDAKTKVIINGTTVAALRGHPGVTVGCAMSFVGMENADQFGHPVYLVSVNPSTLLVVDKLAKDGLPKHAIRYGHNFRKIVDLNDTGELKELIKAHPAIMERPFQLLPPRKRPTGPHGNHTSSRKSLSGIHRVQHTMKGALARAVKAKRIGPSAAEQLSMMASKRKREVAT